MAAGVSANRDQTENRRQIDERWCVDKAGIRRAGPSEHKTGAQRAQREKRKGREADRCDELSEPAERPLGNASPSGGRYNLYRAAGDRGASRRESELVDVTSAERRGVHARSE